MLYIYFGLVKINIWKKKCECAFGGGGQIDRMAYIKVMWVAVKCVNTSDESTGEAIG